MADKTKAELEKEIEKLQEQIDELQADLRDCQNDVDSEAYRADTAEEELSDCEARLP